MSPIRLSNGDMIPKGTFISMPTAMMNKDPSNFPNPETFDYLRFYSPPPSQKEYSKDEEKPNLNPRNDGFASIGPKELWWGNGRFTCPGRWYASIMIKLIIAKLLTECDMSFPDGQTTRPPNEWKDDSFHVNKKQEIILRPRGAT